METRCTPAVFTVINTADSGAGSLRQAILNSNANPGLNTIDFNIPTSDSGFQSSTGSWTITVGSATIRDLPALETPVTIDATSQPGYAGHPLITLSGNSSYPVPDGLVLVNSCTVLGLDVNGFLNDNLLIIGSHNTVQGCYIGTDITGTQAHGALVGILVGGSQSAPDADPSLQTTQTAFNTIGGTTAATRNVISGNGLNAALDGGDPSSGIDVVAVSGTVQNTLIEGNYIGTNAAGTAALANYGYGVFLGPQAISTTIGGIGAGFGNVISGNADAANKGRGIEVFGATDTTIQGNLIGTDLNGNTAIPNAREGIMLENAVSVSGNLVGGTVAGAGNIISGNGGSGIIVSSLSGANTGAVIQGNSIGVSASGAALGNGNNGIEQTGSSSVTTIGGLAAGAGNVIGSNQGNGIQLNGASQIDIFKNFIGTNSSGANLGNGIGGVELDPGSNQAIVAGNTIADNTDGAVLVNDSKQDLISQNGISNNGQAGIQLVANGNNNLVAPILTVATSSGSTTTIQGVYFGAANANFTLEFFIASGSGSNVQGKTFLGSAMVTTDGNGRAVINAVVNTATTSSQSIVATATDGSNNTSAFSNTVAVNTTPSADLSITNTDNVTSAVPGASVVYTIVVSNAGPSEAVGASIADAFPAGITSVSWTASVSAGSHVSALSGTGNISLTADLPSGGTVTITATAAISASATGSLSNTATVTAPAGVTDPNLTNNSATDSDTLVAGTPMTFSVYNTDDVGPGSLHEAILDSNANPGLNTITFAIPTTDPNYHSATNSFTIAPSTDEPTITNPVIIDGTSQSGYAGTPLIELSGVNLTGGGHNGLTLDASGSTIEGLAVNSFTNNGIEIDGQSDDVIQGDFLGTNVLGTTALGNENDGLFLNAASGNQIGGTTFTTASGTFSARNLISGNSHAGVEMTGNLNVLQGNFIGTNLAGTAALANVNGVLSSGNNNLIGGVGGLNGGQLSGAGNLISGNSRYGIVSSAVNGGNGNVIAGNFIGTDVTGSLALGNGTTGAADFGLYLAGETGDTIGGTLPGTGNVISGNLATGLSLLSCSNTEVVGNFIGTNAAGSAALANALIGLSIQDSSNNTIGGTTTAARNVISGNGSDGIYLFQDGSGTSTGNVIEGNFIGTDITGTHALGNGNNGVRIDSGASSNTIGGSAAGAGNVIAANGTGILVSGATTTSDTIDYNFIGTDLTGSLLLGNLTNGVAITAGASSNPTYLNTIANNGNDGILVDTGTTNLLAENSIFNNAHQGIELLNNGNQSQAAPVLASVISDGGVTTVEGTLQSTASTTFTLEFFEDSGSQGKTFLGASEAVTNSSGLATFGINLSAAIPLGQFVTVLALNSNQSTSTFSNALPSSGYDSPGSIEFAPANVIVPLGSGEALIYLVRSGPNTVPVSVQVNTIAGTALPGVDFSAVSETVTWLPGRSVVVVEVPLLGATTPGGGAMSFSLAVSNPSRGAILVSPTSATISFYEYATPVPPPPPAPPLTFVEKIYRDLLSTTVDPTGEAYWNGLLNAGESRSQVIYQIETSGPGYQFYSNIVANLYAEFLHRNVDPVGLNYSVAFLAAGGTVEELESNIIASPEYYQVRGGGSITGFLEAVYADVLNRALDSSGAGNWGTDLLFGVNRAQVVYRIVTSTEGRGDLIASLYESFLHRAASAADLQYWEGQFQQGATDQQVIANILGSTEYLGLP